MTTYEPVPMTEDEARAIAEQGPNAVARKLRELLRARSGITFSARNDTGTAWGWIHVRPTPSRVAKGFQAADEQALADLLGLSRPPHSWQVVDTRDHYAGALQQAAGQPVTIHGREYWD